MTLGVSAIANRVGEENEEEVESSLIDNNLPHALEERIEPLKREVLLLVANVVMTAKEKDSRDWKKDALQDPSRPRRTLARLDPSDMIPLPIFLGGAGAGSEWYQNAILSTYEDRQHRNCGIPPYDLIEVPVPSDLDMNGIKTSGFRRFAIAYGLSVPFGEGPDVGLPSQFGPAETPVTTTTDEVVEYFDHKDAYD